MQDEILKHTKKIFTTAMSTKHSFGEKLWEIVIEICIIVFAVTLSIQLHNWSEHRHEQKEANVFLSGLKHDLTQDIKLLGDIKAIITRLDTNYSFILSLKDNPLTKSLSDSAIVQRLEFQIPVTHPNIGRYDGFKSSGKIGTIENDSLKENILIFYQQTIPDLVATEEYVNSLQLKILDLVLDKSDNIPIRDFVATRKMATLFRLGKYNFKGRMEMYEDARKQAEKIISQIE